MHESDTASNLDLDQRVSYAHLFVRCTMVHLQTKKKSVLLENVSLRVNRRGSRINGVCVPGFFDLKSLSHLDNILASSILFNLEIYFYIKKIYIYSRIFDNLVSENYMLFYCKIPKNQCKVVKTFDFWIFP